MTKKNLAIVLDTNAVISILSRKLNFQHILTALINYKFDLFVTTEILIEYEEKISLFFDKSQAHNFLSFLDLLTNVHKIETFYKLNLLNDPDDNKFVDCAFACNAS